ncbi:MAG: DNA repair protein RecN, partial [Anaerotardibacter sp.]
LVEVMFFRKLSEDLADDLFDELADELLVKRRISANGRSRAYLNGEIASAKDLASAVGSEIDLCGQHEHQHLLKPAYQLDCLDAWGNTSAKLVAYQDAFRAYTNAKKEREALIERNQNNQLELDKARFVVDKINEINPLSGEYETLVEEMPRYEHGEMLTQNAQSNLDLLKRESGILSQIDELRLSVQNMAALDETLKPLIQLVDDSYYALEEVSSQLNSYVYSLDFSFEELESRQSRMSELQGLIRTFGSSMEQVFQALEKNQALLNEHDSLDEILAQKDKEVAELKKVLEQKAEALSKVRMKAAKQFAQAISEQLTLLNMKSAAIVPFFEDLPHDQWSSKGSQKFELLFTPGESVEPASLTQIASGGEISRVMLAIKVCIGSVDSVETLIFDEIDAGVGGQTARLLGQVLKGLAETHQVIVVTHLAQVAALGDVHYLVEKSEGNTLQTTLKVLPQESRIEEIARMLSGEITDLSLAHAKELLGE